MWTYGPPSAFFFTHSLSHVHLLTHMHTQSQGWVPCPSLPLWDIAKLPESLLLGQVMPGGMQPVLWASHEPGLLEANIVGGMNREQALLRAGSNSQHVLLALPSSSVRTQL